MTVACDEPSSAQGKPAPPVERAHSVATQKHGASHTPATPKRCTASAHEQREETDVERKVAGEQQGDEHGDDERQSAVDVHHSRRPSTACR